jgi:hypothetical protein
VSSLSFFASLCQHPDVISGKRKEGAILKEFLDTFDQGDHDGKVF